MGVLNCSRKGCEKIMCDRHSHTYGYICHECFSELVDNGAETDIGMFMITPKRVMKTPTEDSFERFEKEFPLP